MLVIELSFNNLIMYASLSNKHLNQSTYEKHFFSEISNEVIVIRIHETINEIYFRETNRLEMFYPKTFTVYNSGLWLVININVCCFCMKLSLCLKKNFSEFQMFWILTRKISI